MTMEIDIEKGFYKVNSIDNAYGKGNENGTNYDLFIDKNIKAGRLIYINKEKTAKWLQSSSSDSTGKGNDLNSLLLHSIPNENNLRKRREEMLG